MNGDPIGLSVMPESNAVRPEDAEEEGGGVCSLEGQLCPPFDPPQMMLGCHRDESQISYFLLT